MSEITELMFRHILRDLEGLVAFVLGGITVGNIDEKTGDAVFDILVDAKDAIEDLRGE